MNDSLDHLRGDKRRELDRIVEILFEEFEAVRARKTTDKNQRGRILKIILFGSFARGDWVEDHRSGYKSDYDLLIIVNKRYFCDFEFWERAEERFLTDPKIDHDVQIVVEPFDYVNSLLSQRQYFFSDIRDQGVALYEADPMQELAQAKPLNEAEFIHLSQQHFEKVFPYAAGFLKGAHFYIEEKQNNLSAFSLHQATEHAYAAFLLVHTHYKPDIHHIGKLRGLSENIDKNLIEIWPRNTRLARRRFELLRRAYVEARYSEHYEITHEDLDWLTERVTLLHQRIEAACKKRLEQ